MYSIIKEILIGSNPLRTEYNQNISYANTQFLTKLYNDFKETKIIKL